MTGGHFLNSREEMEFDELREDLHITVMRGHGTGHTSTVCKRDCCTSVEFIKRTYAIQYDLHNMFKKEYCLLEMDILLHGIHQMPCNV